MPHAIMVPVITIDGIDLETKDRNTHLVNLRVSRTSGAAATAQLWLDMTHSDCDWIQIGSDIKISAVALESGPSDGPIFTGSVTSLGIEVETRRTHLIVGAHDASFPLGQKTISSSRLNMSAKAIITSIAADFGLTADIDSVLGVDMLEHVQESGTAHQFITEIARTFGCEWFVEAKKLVIRRRVATAPMIIKGDEELRRFSARFSAIEQVQSVTVRRWDSAHKQVVSGSKDLSTTDDLARSNVPITVRAHRRSRTVRRPGTGVTIPGLVADAAKPDSLAEGIVRRHESAMLTGRGEVDVRPDLKPGVRVEITDVKTEWNGTYYVTAVEHVFGDSKPFVSRFVIGELEPTTIVDLLGSPATGMYDRIASSLAIGVVTDNNDPDRLNRVKVRIPALSDDNESRWARLVQQGAGKNRGWVTVPEIDDEVVVAFEHGDIQRPFVLGGLWSGKDQVPDVKDGVKNGRVESRSFTSRLGHRIEFRDGPNEREQHVLIVLNDKKTKLHLGTDKIEIHAADKPIQVKTKDATIDLTEAGDVKIEAVNIVINAKQNLDLKAAQITIDAKNAATIKGVTVTAEGKAQATLRSNGQTVVKGTIVNVN